MTQQTSNAFTTGALTGTATMIVVNVEDPLAAWVVTPTNRTSALLDK